MAFRITEFIRRVATEKMADDQDVRSGGEISHLLARIDAGETGAVDDLFSQIYGQLKVIARRGIRTAKDRELLQTTAIVNEACLRMTSEGFAVSLKNRRRLFAAASRAVQCVLIDYARKRQAKKRAATTNSLMDDVADQYDHACGGSLLDLVEPLEELKTRFPRVGRVVESRFWGGLTIKETAELLEVSVDSVKRDWRFARAFLRSRLD